MLDQTLVELGSKKMSQPSIELQLKLTTPSRVHTNYSFYKPWLTIQVVQNLHFGDVLSLTWAKGMLKANCISNLSFFSDSPTAAGSGLYTAQPAPSTSQANWTRDRHPPQLSKAMVDRRFEVQRAYQRPQCLWFSPNSMYKHACGCHPPTEQREIWTTLGTWITLKLDRLVYDVCCAKTMKHAIEAFCSTLPETSQLLSPVTPHLKPSRAPTQQHDPERVHIRAVSQPRSEGTSKPIAHLEHSSSERKPPRGPNFSFWMDLRLDIDRTQMETPRGIQDDPMAIIVARRV